MSGEAGESIKWPNKGAGVEWYLNKVVMLVDTSIQYYEVRFQHSLNELGSGLHRNACLGML